MSWTEFIDTAPTLFQGMTRISDASHRHWCAFETDDGAPYYFNTHLHCTYTRSLFLASHFPTLPVSWRRFCPCPLCASLFYACPLWIHGPGRHFVFNVQLYRTYIAADSLRRKALWPLRHCPRSSLCSHYCWAAGFGWGLGLGLGWGVGGWGSRVENWDGGWRWGSTNRNEAEGWGLRVGWSPTHGKKNDRNGRQKRNRSSEDKTLIRSYWNFGLVFVDRLRVRQTRLTDGLVVNVGIRVHVEVRVSIRVRVKC